MRTFIVGAVLITTAWSQSPAQDFTGTYSVMGSNGPVTLSINQDAQGNLTGSMTGGAASFQVEGMLEGPVAVGIIYNQEGGVYFEADLEGSQLSLRLIEPDANNNPDYSRVQELTLTRQGAGQAATPQRRFPSLPGASGANPLSRTEGTLIGSWYCQTPEGPAQLQFVSENQLTYNGEGATYELAGGKIRVPGEYGPVEYPYQLSGDQLTITDPAGGVSRCQRQSGQANRSGQGLAGPGASGLEYMLQGMLCSYSGSSSSQGWYYSSNRVSFDGQGRFRLGHEGGFDVQSGFGATSDPGQMGTYRVLGPNKGDRVQLTFADGSVEFVTVYHIYQGQITELQHGETHYGKGLCD